MQDIHPRAANELRDRRRVGDLSYDDLLLAAYVGHPAAGDLLSPLDLPAETSKWIRSMEQFEHPVWVRAALAASARLVPSSDTDARASFVGLMTRIGDWLDCPCNDHAAPIRAATARCTSDGTAAGAARAEVAGELLRAIGPDRAASLDAACLVVATVEEFLAQQAVLVRRIVGAGYQWVPVRETIRDAIAPWALATDELESFLRRSA